MSHHGWTLCTLDVRLYSWVKYSLVDSFVMRKKEDMFVDQYHLYGFGIGSLFRFYLPLTLLSVKVICDNQLSRV